LLTNNRVIGGFNISPNTL